MLISIREKSQLWNVINHLRMELKKGDKSAGVAEKKLLVYLPVYEAADVSAAEQSRAEQSFIWRGMRAVSPGQAWRFMNSSYNHGSQK